MLSMTKEDAKSSKNKEKVEKTEQKQTWVKSPLALDEEKILAFWNEKKIFQKILDRENTTGDFVFYDGPPFATGLPHYGHILAGTIKDIFPRFQSMLGKHVRRQWGWDCHGLPIENLIEKELGLNTKKDIEELGIEKFNNAAKNSVLRYEVDWAKIVPRAGRWIDMENKYQTMDPEYTESIWWAFKNLYEKDLVYKGYKSMHLCPRCGTTLSNFEVNQGYKDVKDISVTVKFELVDEPNTFLLAWTTTPWTLPGNSATAINPEIKYVKVKTKESDELYIVAKERLDFVFKNGYEIVSEIDAKSLVGKSYKPLFDYYTKEDFEGKRKNAWKIYAADYVTVEDGTGAVHLAPAFGEIDMLLAQKKGIPLIQHVDPEGKIRPEAKDFAGMFVKPKSDDDKIRLGTDIAVLKYLQDHGSFFSKENVVHSYPHCWRCDTPLLNYASTSWFISVPKMKDKMIAENAKVDWVPKEVGENRFGKWLEGARDWAVSRTRYWGAPLPVWECETCKAKKVFGGMEELRNSTPANNTYFVMRHGQADFNVKGLISSEIDNVDPLTEEGKNQTLKSAKELKGKGIDLIIASDFQRTKETAEIVAKEIGLDTSAIIFDKRIREMSTGNLNKHKWSEYESQYKDSVDRMTPGAIKEGETYGDIKRRAGDFLFDIDKKYSGKKILIVSHGGPILCMHMVTHMATKKKSLRMNESGNFKHENAEWREIQFVPFSHNADFEIDFHKPYIDLISVTCDCGKEMKRVPDVFDCWFESGAMPFAQHHYPFENKDIFDPERKIGFPADFIAEGLDQTRGWFYTLLVLGIGLFGQSPYKNVIVNGLVLAEDGKKMSKRLRNYPDVNYVFDTYGADAMRYYMVSSPVVHSEDLRFSEKGVDEVVKKIIMRLSNVYSFYEMYKNDVPHINVKESTNVLDVWMLSRLAEVRDEVTERMIGYELDKATRPFSDLIDDLSTWYLRRSRDRFKGDDILDKTNALATARLVLLQTTKLLAPFMPFVSESIYQKLKSDTDAESVHMCSWPEREERSGVALSLMAETRKAVTSLLTLRAKANIKVRQPLSSAVVNSEKLSGKEDFLSIIADEVNVKKVTVDTKQSEEVTLDTNITDELKDEGLVRDMIRGIQEERKNLGLSPKDTVNVTIEVTEKGKNIIEKYQSEISSVCGIEKIETIVKEIDTDIGIALVVKK